MKAFSALESLLAKSNTSSLYRICLNVVLHRIIPFNRGHGYRVERASAQQGTIVFIPHRTRNLNHIGGIHACALATGAELCAGMSLLAQFSPKDYRLIMSNIEISYQYQAKRDCRAKCNALSQQEIAHIKECLQIENKAQTTVEVEIRDKEEALVCIAKVTWQLKRWSAVTSPRP